MSRASVLARGRAAAAASFIDTCTIRRLTGQVNDGNGGVTETWTQIYSGPCRVQEASIGGDATPERPGETTVLLVRRELQLPVITSTGIKADDHATIDTCVNDPDLVGRVLVVANESSASEKTARRLAMREVT